MNAAKIALEKCAHLFPHLNYQKRIMERSFKRQGVVGDIVRDNWYQETLKRRQELGMDKEEKPEVKQEIVPEEKQEVKHNVALAESSDISPAEAPKVETNASKKDNKEAVRAEIREIENKLLKKKQKKTGKKNGTEIEDGECIDSEEDFDKIEVDKSCAAAAPTPEEISKKKKEENKKRWKDPNKGSEQGTSRASEERGRDKVKKNEKKPHSPDKRDRRGSSDSSRGSGGRGGYSGYGRRGEGGDRREGRPYSQYSSGGNYRHNYYDSDQRQYRY